MGIPAMNLKGKAKKKLHVVDYQPENPLPKGHLAEDHADDDVLIIPYVPNFLVFRRCCCGCTLKTGTILIALWYQAASLVQLATMTYRWQTGDYMGGENDQTLQRMFGTGENALIPHPYLDSIEVMYTYPLLLTCLVMNSFEVATCSMLLFGAMKERPGFMLPWIVVETIVACSSSIIMVQVSAAFLSDDEFYVAGVIGLTACAIFMVVSGYFILIVYSYYRNLRLHQDCKDDYVDEESQTQKALKDVTFIKPILQLDEKKYASLSEA